MKTIAKKILTIAAISTISTGAFAATNPTNPTSGSSGGAGLADLTISATVNALFKISGLTDITFAAYTGSGAWTASDTFCVYTNGAAGVYSVTVTGSSGAGAGFNLHNGTNTIPYTVNYNSGNPIVAGPAVSSGGPLAGRQGNAFDPTCANALFPPTGDNASVTITIDESNAQSAPASATAYTGLLTFLIAP